MEKIIIQPYNEEIKLMAEAVELRNDFVKKGFHTRAAFIGLVQSCDAKYLEYKEVTKLERWWNMRTKDVGVQKDLIRILNQIENE